jgi:hypothetical protein
MTDLRLGDSTLMTFASNNDTYVSGDISCIYGIYIAAIRKPHIVPVNTIEVWTTASNL